MHVQLGPMVAPEQHFDAGPIGFVPGATQVHVPFAPAVAVPEQQLPATPRSAAPAGTHAHLPPVA
jgi:hypothetical protein